MDLFKIGPSRHVNTAHIVDVSDNGTTTALTMSDRRAFFLTGQYREEFIAKYMREEQKPRRGRPPKMKEDTNDG